MPTNPPVRVRLNPDGYPTHFFPESFFAPETIPSDTIEVPYLAYLEFVQFPGLRRWDGAKVVVGRMTAEHNLQIDDNIKERLFVERERVIVDMGQMEIAIARAIRGFGDVENALAELMSKFFPDNHDLGFSLYFTPRSTEARITLIDTCFGNLCGDKPDRRTLLGCWTTLRAQIIDVKATRNRIAHGHVGTHTIGNNSNEVRLTFSHLDFRLRINNLIIPKKEPGENGGGGHKTQMPGLSVRQVLDSALKCGKLSLMTKSIQWPVTQMLAAPNEPSLWQQACEELQRDLPPSGHPPKNAQRPSKPKGRGSPSPPIK